MLRGGLAISFCWCYLMVSWLVSVEGWRIDNRNTPECETDVNEPWKLYGASESSKPRRRAKSWVRLIERSHCHWAIFQHKRGGFVAFDSWFQVASQRPQSVERCVPAQPSGDPDSLHTEESWGWNILSHGSYSARIFVEFVFLWKAGGKSLQRSENVGAVHRQRAGALSLGAGDHRSLDLLGVGKRQAGKENIVGRGRLCSVEQKATRKPSSSSPPKRPCLLPRSDLWPESSTSKWRRTRIKSSLRLRVSITTWSTTVVSDGLAEG